MIGIYLIVEKIIIQFILLISGKGTYNFKVVITNTDGEIAEAEKSYYLYCFLAGTKVSTKSGLKNIEDIKVGDYVYTFNEATNEIELKEVLVLHKNDVTYNICRIYVEDEYIESTDGHQYYVKGKGWVAACNLKEGDILVNMAGIEKNVKKVEWIKNNDIKTVYNLTVRDNHNYFVGENALLVHNIPGSCGDGAVVVPI